jgi:hypothetical protein
MAGTGTKQVEAGSADGIQQQIQVRRDPVAVSKSKWLHGQLRCDWLVRKATVRLRFAVVIVVDLRVDRVLFNGHRPRAARRCQVAALSLRFEDDIVALNRDRDAECA